MTQDQIFAAYYVQYRTEADTPNNSDDEYIIFTGLANEAISRWANYDNTFWKELWSTLQVSGDGDSTIVTGQSAYACPADMGETGGLIRIIDPSTGHTVQRLKVIEAQDSQFQSDMNNYAYFIGDPSNGYTLVINPAPVDAWNGFSIDYVYYKKPTYFTTTQSKTEMKMPYFIVHRALSSRFRGSRNPYYQSAKNDAEDVLRTMQLNNNSGGQADPWKLADNSGTFFGG